MPPSDGQLYKKLHNLSAKFLKEKDPKRSDAHNANHVQKSKKSTQKSANISSPEGRSSRIMDQD
jgi:hypothetical protein